jgi:hypothetical protein
VPDEGKLRLPKFSGGLRAPGWPTGHPYRCRRQARRAGTLARSLRGARAADLARHSGLGAPTIIRTAVEHLDVLTLGGNAARSAELLASARMAGLIEDLGVATPTG